MKTSAIILLLSLFASTAQAGFYCGSKIVDVGDSSFSVRDKCGEPQYKDSDGAACSLGYSAAVCKSITVWTYRGDPGQFSKMVVFEGGKVVEIKLGDRQ
jgi:hypothetical protein